MPSDGPWEMSGPEEGDEGDLGVFVSNQEAGSYDVIEITFGTLSMKKAAARKIADILNRNQGKLVT